jgi:hypothetical protein
MEGGVPLPNQTHEESMIRGAGAEEINPGKKMNIQIYAQESKAMSERSELPVAERNLWVAILLQALEDWQTGTLRRRKEAERFIFHCESDFAAVCRGAGLDPACVLAKLQRIKQTETRPLKIEWIRVA